MRWQPAELVAAWFETPTARTLSLRVAGWPGHLPGQHIDVRLTAPDGYRAERSYSLAAPANGELIEITVQRVPSGEVSEYLVDVFPVGALIEVRGPVGGWFVWQPERGAAVLVGGGSGIVPIMSMVRARSGADVPVRVIYSLRGPEEQYYRDELTEKSGLDLFLAYTRTAPPGNPRPPHRLTRAELDANGLPPAANVTCYVCGPTGFVESVAATLVSLGHDPAAIRTERFGPSGK
ncbi:ferredoxin reductase [Nocardia sp. NPDC049149]|uniref:ferredoxin reductase n=1 Tax=Nocardia sp. NPDC049149 TaxID=3364315 RepID=UPI0037109DB2